MVLQKLEQFEELILPRIIGNATFKRAISLQIFTEPRLAEKFHTLTVGTIATAKSDMALELSKVVMGSQYTGKRVTPKGMFDALTFANDSLLFADELDKINKQVREQMLEVMQSQQAKEDKHNKHFTHSARTNVAAFCNPRGYVLNDDTPIIHQIPFHLPLVSRFHFFLAVKPVDPDFYPDIAAGLSRMNMEDDNTRRRKLAEYIIRVKQACPEVSISEQLARKIGMFVKTVREMSPMKEVISPRLIEGLLSATKARARMNLKTTVSLDDWLYVRKIVDELYL